MKKVFIFLLVALFSFSVSETYASNEWEEINQTEKNKEKKSKKDKKADSVRTGWTFGILPSVSYDADLGFQYGALSNIYYFGDGSTYPEYLHSFYVEASYTTKRYGVFRFFYDSKYLIPKHRLTLDVSYLPDAMCDFLGYNGYQTVYNDYWRNSKKYTIEDGYRTRAFYKFKRDIFRFMGDIQGTIHGNWKWGAGLGVLGYNIGGVDIDMLNKGKKPEKILPGRDSIPGLYDKFVQWNIIKENEKNGGWHPYVRAGIAYDSRDKQQNPNKGIYADVFLTYYAAFGKQANFNNLKFNATFRHYVPIYKDYISFAYRVGVQLNAAGDCPFYLNSYLNNMYMQRVMYEGLGGGNSLRGVMRNRILANGVGFANVEFRFKICKFTVGKEHFYIGLNPLFDIGMVLQPYELDETMVKKAIRENDPSFDINTLDQYLKFGKDARIYRPHMSAGIGFKAAMNENFILSVDWAVPFDKQDNAGMANLYVKIGYMF